MTQLLSKYKEESSSLFSVHLIGLKVNRFDRIHFACKYSVQWRLDVWGNRGNGLILNGFEVWGLGLGFFVIGDVFV